MRVLIVGCGYVGLPLGAELAKQGHEVFGLRRTSSAAAELQAAGVKPLLADITKLRDLQRLPGPFDWVVNTVSSTKGGVGEYLQVYLQGMRNLIAWLAPAPPKKFIYTSSTSVYGQTDGSLVEETSATEPASETSQVLLQTEQFLLEAGWEGRGSGGSVGASERASDGRGGASERGVFPGLILRVAGIYGPGRGSWWRQYLRGEARISGKGEQILNMIHRDDLVGIIIAALKHGQPGEIYNAVDDEPVAQIDLFRWLAETLGRAMPAFVPEAGQAARKRGLTNKKVSNRKVKLELGYRFTAPTFREGFRASSSTMS